MWQTVMPRADSGAWISKLVSLMRPWFTGWFWHYIYICVCLLFVLLVFAYLYYLLSFFSSYLTYLLPSRTGPLHFQSGCRRRRLNPVFSLLCLFCVIHRVPKLVTPLASNTLNFDWISWISTKYRTLHYLNITYCHTCYDVRILLCVLSVTHYDVRVCMGWTCPAYYWQGDKAVAHPPKSLRQGQRWPLWAQILKTSSEWSSPWMFHIL